MRAGRPAGLELYNFIQAEREAAGPCDRPAGHQDVVCSALRRRPGLLRRPLPSARAAEPVPLAAGWLCEDERLSHGTARRPGQGRGR